ncbi:hypothetical protein AKO1_002901 [Acrasis kona]|uniref:Uncharacterized protein n=1 Tax=Acrasis kona TaxID=1008807 RepID=A0AAW2YST2_9EUKA
MNKRPVSVSGPCYIGTVDTHPHNESLSAELEDFLEKGEGKTLHPLVKASWHISNHNLYKAHRYIRGVQERPWAMWLHSILHRLEGDMINTKCWIYDIDLPEFIEFWKSKELAYKFIDRSSLCRGWSPEKICQSVEQTSGDGAKVKEIKSYYNIDELKVVKDSIDVKDVIEEGDKELDFILKGA